MSQQGAGGTAKDCTACHNNTSWREIPGFDHSATNFPLAGGHRQASCDRCHRRSDPKPEWKEVRFQSAPHACSSCHEDEHEGQFSLTGGTDCSRCHNEGKWKPSLFDHARGASYSLTGAHRNTSCRACHLSRDSVEKEKKVTVFKGTPRECSGCHTGKTPGIE
jgi:hypothetical protein